MDYGDSQNKIQLSHSLLDLLDDDGQLEFYQLFVIMVYSQIDISTGMERKTPLPTQRIQVWKKKIVMTY